MLNKYEKYEKMMKEDLDMTKKVSFNGYIFYSIVNHFLWFLMFFMLGLFVKYLILTH